MANYKNKNLRNMEVNPSSQGEEAKDSSQLNGTAKPTAAFKATNELVQYTTSGTDKGQLGGLPSRS